MSPDPTSRPRWRRRPAVAALVGGIVTVLAVVLPPTAADAATTTLKASTLVTTQGSTGGQPVTALGVQDQSGTTDTWAKYVEFNGQYAGYATYALPAGISPSSVTGLQVLANYRGPATTTQTWTWSVWNWSTGAWAPLGTNAGAPDWGAWRQLTFTASGTPSAYVSSTQGVRVQLRSNNAADAADVDYLAVSLTTGTAPTDITAPSSPTGLAVTAKTSSSVSLSWGAATDDVGVTGYEVFQGTSTTPVATATATSATVNGLAASTAYSFTVKARDAAGNRSAASTAVTTTTPAASTVTLPPANGVFDYQIGGPYTPAASTAIVDRDRTASPVAGKYNICYINAFQTQPGESGSWPSNLLLRNASGQLVEDAGWPGEYILDTRTAAKRSAILAVLGPWMQDCKNRGFAAIEPDNLDSYTRSTGLISRPDNVAMATLLASDAHARGLAIAQKNDTDIAPVGRSQIGFDFAIVEECQPFSECGAFTSVYGTQVYEIEYTDEGGVANFDAACTARGSTISITYRDRNVVPLGTSGYVFQSC
jgi:Glycoside-hydrolase family GH114/N-terminal glycosyl-hydrolase-114-associated domain/Fibronectin type III domain